MNNIRAIANVVLVATLPLGAASGAAFAQAEHASCRAKATELRDHPDSDGAMDRLAALQVLMRYYNPRYAPSIDALRTAPEWSSVAWRVDGPRPIDGTSPLADSTRPQIAGTLARLAASESDSTVRNAALVLRKTLAYDDPANTPLAPGAIALIAGCGNRVTLRSTADVGVRVVLRVLGTTFERTHGIRAGSQAKPAVILLGLPSGTVVASYGGREVARLEERNAPCPPWLVP